MGSGQGTSVLELVQTFEKVTGVKVPYTIEARREGDIESMYANCNLAKNDLGWTAKYTLEDMCRLRFMHKLIIKIHILNYNILGKDFWKWHTMNPNGYKTNDTTNMNGNMKNY